MASEPTAYQRAYVEAVAAQTFAASREKAAWGRTIAIGIAIGALISAAALLLG